MYVGRAINANHPPLGDDAVLADVGHHIIPAVYVVPFTFLAVPLILVLIFICVYKETMKEFKSRIANDLQVQGNLAAITLICCIFTIYAFGLDMKSIVDENNANLPIFFHRKSYGFYFITIIFTSFSLLFDVIGIFWFIVAWFHNLILSCHQSDCCNNSCCNFFVHNVILPCCKKLDNSCCNEVYFPMLFCIASALLTLSFHFQNILIAWSTDPFYASRIALFYGIIAFCYFTSFKYAYIFPLKLSRRNNSPNRGNEGPNKSDHWNIRELIAVAISLFFAIGLSSGVIITVVLFFTHVPINNSIENSLTGLTTIFNGAVVLIGGFIAYRVSVKYFGNPFSLEDALKDAMNEIKKTPFKSKPDDNGNWSKLTEEGRMTEVIKALIHRETSKGYPYPDSSSQTFNPEHF